MLRKERIFLRFSSFFVFCYMTTILNRISTWCLHQPHTLLTLSPCQLTRHSLYVFFSPTFAFFTWTEKRTGENFPFFHLILRFSRNISLVRAEFFLYFWGFFHSPTNIQQKKKLYKNVIFPPANEKFSQYKEKSEMEEIFSFLKIFTQVQIFFYIKWVCESVKEYLKNQTRITSWEKW
jgi:hypothetical protein